MTDSNSTTRLDSVMGDEPWFCDRGGFWGTVNQICRCAKCGETDRKHRDEPRHYGGIFTAQLHVLCDGCYESLPASSPVSEGEKL